MKSTLEAERGRSSVRLQSVQPGAVWAITFEKERPADAIAFATAARCPCRHWLPSAIRRLPNFFPRRNSPRENSELPCEFPAGDRAVEHVLGNEFFFEARFAPGGPRAISGGISGGESFAMGLGIFIFSSRIPPARPCREAGDADNMRSCPGK